MRTKGFTLIELLIVVAIIAILAAIAVPNFLEAQTRSRVSRVNNDLRTISLGMESYRIDNNSYPASLLKPDGTYLQAHIHFPLLTTPVAYVNSIPPDIFIPLGSTTTNTYRIYACGYVDYVNAPYYARSFNQYPRVAWMTWSIGPDKTTQTGAYYTLPRVIYNEARATPASGEGMRYDSTNGTVSQGDIYRFDGEAATRLR